MTSPDLRPTIVQDAATGRMLMLAWTSDESLRLTRETGQAHFFSRSRQKLWRKGETSGNTLAVEEIVEDCDEDAVLFRVHPSGPVCHTGSLSCFAPWLWQTIRERVDKPVAGSYTNKLLDGGPRAAAQKVGEEGVEVALAAVGEGDERLISEVADLWYHVLVLLAARGLDPQMVEDELTRRRH